MRYMLTLDVCLHEVHSLVCLYFNIYLNIYIYVWKFAFDMTKLKELKRWALTPPLTLAPPRILTLPMQRQTKRERVRDRGVAQLGDGTVGVGEGKRETAVCCRTQMVAMATGMEGAASYTCTHSHPHVHTHTV